jgi:hypothetical protein
MGAISLPSLDTMATIKQPANPEADPRVKAVFDDIRATRRTDFVNNLWRSLAFDPALLGEHLVRGETRHGDSLTA